MGLHVVPALGTNLVADVRRGHVQALVDELVAEGLSGSRVRNVLNALRSFYVYAIARDLVETSPIASIRLPAMNERPRDRVATSAEFGALLAALEAPDALPFALAGYATARNQEIVGMRWPAVRWEQQTLRLAEDPAYANSDAARRAFPVIPQLRGRLREQWLRQGRPPGDALVCPGQKPGGRNSGRLSISALYARADRVWRASDLKPIRLHEARHTASSWMRAAGIDLKVRSTLMGHATIASTDSGRRSITEDRYTHPLPGDIEAAGQALAAYLQAHSTPARSGTQG
jgi:integrase